MDRMTKAIMQGSALAVKLAKSLISTPNIVIKDTKIKWSVPIEVESYNQHGDAEVSESLIYTTGSSTADKKSYIADNVAPGPWTWTLTGYIPGSKLIEMTNLFTPMVMTNTLILQAAFKRGAVVGFKDINCKYFENCVIQSLDIDNRPDVQNKRPVSVTLKEINIKNAETGNGTSEKSSPTGANAADATSKGAVTATKMTTSTLKAGATKGITAIKSLLGI